MSDMPKFIMDDHARIRRSFNDYQRTRSDLDAALNVCDHLWIHLTIEVELVHPAVWDELGRRTPRCWLEPTIRSLA